MLRKAPPHVISDIIEVLYNILHGNCKLTYYQKKIVMENKKPIVNLMGNATKKRLKQRARQLIHKQKGGFIGALLPVIASVLGGLVAQA